MSLQVRQALHEVVPTLEGAPPRLLAHIDALYQLSLARKPTLPPGAEVARYHVCTFLAVERLQHRLGLPPPRRDKIPVAPRLLQRVLDDVGAAVPPLPRKQSAPATPTKTTRPRVGSPLKRLQGKTPSSAFDAESPFNPLPAAAPAPTAESPESSAAAAAGGSPLKRLAAGSPLKRLALAPLGSPAKRVALGTTLKPALGLPVGSPASGAASPAKSKRLVSIPDLIAFCNHFFIPATVTPHILLSFGHLRQKFAKKNEWLLACGMVHTAYTRINHQMLAKRIGATGEFEDQLFQYQKGGLMKHNMMIWCSIVADMLRHEGWLVQLERDYSAHRLHFVNLMQQEREDRGRWGPEACLGLFGAMVDASVMFLLPLQRQYYEVWLQRARQQAEERGERDAAEMPAGAAVRDAAA